MENHRMRKSHWVKDNSIAPVISLNLRYKRCLPVQCLCKPCTTVPVEPYRLQSLLGTYTWFLLHPTNFFSNTLSSISNLLSTQDLPTYNYPNLEIIPDQGANANFNSLNQSLKYFLLSPLYKHSQATILEIGSKTARGQPDDHTIHKQDPVNNRIMFNTIISRNTSG